jgi:NADPH2:quinone reductase
VFIRQGLYRDRPGLPQPPYVPGLEVAGTVRALGEGVCRVRGRRARGDLTGQQRHGGYAAIFVSDAAYVASMKDVSLPGHKDLARPAAAAAIIAAAAGLAQAHVETLPLTSATVVHERLENHSVNGRLVLHP